MQVNGRRVVFVQKRVAQPIVRIQPLFQREQLLCSGIRLVKLLSCGVKLVRQVVAASCPQHGADELPSPDTNPISRIVAGPLLVIEHQGERLSTGPGQQRSGVRMRVSNRNVDDVHAMTAEYLAHGSYAGFERVDRNKIFLQDIGGGCTLHRFQLGHIVACLVVAPVHRFTGKKNGIDQVLPAPFAERRLGNRPQEIFFQQMLAAMPLQAGTRRRRSTGFGPGLCPYPNKIPGVDISIVEHHIRIVSDGVAEESTVAGQRHLGGVSLDTSVLIEAELGFDDHAQRTVAANTRIEELGVEFGTRIDHIATDQCHANRLSR
jgi:hypothetical protein